MNASEPVTRQDDDATRRRRVALARQAFKELHAQCFWSYRIVAELCR